VIRILLHYNALRHSGGGRRTWYLPEGYIVAGSADRWPTDVCSSCKARTHPPPFALQTVSPSTVLRSSYRILPSHDNGRGGCISSSSHPRHQQLEHDERQRGQCSGLQRVIFDPTLMTQ
jgi:hypothetical protein